MYVPTLDQLSVKKKNKNTNLAGVRLLLTIKLVSLSLI